MAINMFLYSDYGYDYDDGMVKDIPADGHEDGHKDMRKFAMHYNMKKVIQKYERNHWCEF